jgi:hypothetical protein
MNEFNIEIQVGTNPAPEITYENTQALLAGDNIITHGKNKPAVFAAVFSLINGVKTSISYSMVIDEENDPLNKCIISVGEDITEAYIKIRF